MDVAAGAPDRHPCRVGPEKRAGPTKLPPNCRDRAQAFAKAERSYANTPCHSSGAVMNAPRPQSRWAAALRTALRLGVILFLVWAIHGAIEEAMYFAEALPDAQRRLALPALIAVSLLVYAALIAIPFVPGVEIGVALLMLQGAEIAPLVYLATLTGLLGAFLIGNYVPLTWIGSAFRDLGLKKPAQLFSDIEHMSRAERVVHLQSHLPDWAAPYMIRFRYLGLVLLLNTPGSSVIGGGGGIAMIAGLSGLFSIRATALSIALAVAPVPLFFWLR